MLTVAFLKYLLEHLETSQYKAIADIVVVVLVLGGAWTLCARWLLDAKSKELARLIHQNAKKAAASYKESTRWPDGPESIRKIVCVVVLVNFSYWFNPAYRCFSYLGLAD